MTFDDSLHGLFHGPECANETYHIRWGGLLRPQRAQTYTMYAGRRQPDERVKVWVSNQLLIDMWTSLGALTEKSGTVSFGEAGGYYQVAVEYASDKSGRGVELSWETESQPRGLVRSEIFSGSESPPETQEYRFKSFPEQGFKLKVGAKTILNTLDDIEAVADAGLLLQPDTWYTLEMEYADVREFWTANLSWAFPGKEFEEIPSALLMYSLGDISASPFSVYVAAERAAADKCRFLPPSSSRLPVGTRFSIDVQAFDRFDNQVVTGDDTFLGLISYPKDISFAASRGMLVEKEPHTTVKTLPLVRQNMHSEYALATRAGSATLSVGLLSSLGIAATYFSDDNFSPLAAVRATVLSSIDFSASSRSAPPSSSLPANSTYSIRWAGMLQSFSAQTYTVYGTRKAASERVKVWIDNTLLIDMWSSLDGAREESGTIKFDAAGKYYNIQVEYKSSPVRNRTNETNLTQVGSGLQIAWRSNMYTNSSRQVINGSDYAVTASVPRSSNKDTTHAFPVEFDTADCNVRSSKARGNGISIATVGGLSFFTVVARDVYENELRASQALNTLRTHGASRYPFSGQVVWNGSEYHVQYEATYRGYAQVTVQMKCSEIWQEIPQSPFNVSVEQASHFDPLRSRIIGSSMTVVTAGLPVTFKIDLRDKFGSPWYSKQAGLSALFNGKRTFQYESSVINVGRVVSVVSSSAFHLYDDVADDLRAARVSGEYIGFSIAVGAERRLIVSCVVSAPNANAFVTVSSPFSILPTEGIRYEVYSATDPDTISQGDGINLTMTHTSSGSYLMEVKQTSGEGLEGAYYFGEFESKMFTQVDAGVDFQWSTMSPMAPYFKVVEDGNLQFTTRWTGYIFSSLAQEYSFHTKLAGPDDRVKLWIDSKLVLDHWSSLQGKILPTVLDHNCRDREGQIEICRCACNETTVSCSTTTSCWTGMCSCEFTIEPSGVALLDSWIMHSLVLEYKNTAHKSGISLQWSTNGVGGNIQQQTISPFFLRPSAVHVNGSPAEVRVVPGEVSFKHSSTEVRTTVMTAGAEMSFQVVARDSFSNVRDFDRGRSQLVSRVIYDQKPAPQHNAGVRDPALHAALTRDASMVTGEYKFSVKPQIASRSAPLFTSLVTAGGIFATYFSDADLRPSAAVKAIVAATIDFSSPAFQAPTAFSVPANSSFSVRWSGMLRPIHPDTYTMYASRQVAEERVKVWIDNVLLIDMWSSLWDENELSATVKFRSAGEYYDIKVEYKKEQSSTEGGAQGVQLRWKNAHANSSVVPAHALFQEHAIGTVPRLLIHPAAVCRSVSTCSGPSLMTAGVHATFRILLRDQFLNIQGQQSQTVAGTLFPGELAENYDEPWALKEGQYTIDESCATLTTVEPAGEDGLMSLSVSTTLAGAHDLNLVVVTRGGLLGAYHNGCVALEAETVMQRVDPVISFEWNQALATISGLNPARFSAQWQGFLQVPGDDMYTFTVISNGAVQLYINGIIVTDFSASADGQRERTLHLLDKRLYKVDLRFSTRTENSYLQLRWQSVTYVEDEVVPLSNFLHTHQPLAVSPFQSSINVLATTPCSTNSFVTGVALTLSTAGGVSQFSIKSRDEYGNLRRLKDDRFIAKVFTPSGRSMDLNVALKYKEASHVVTYRQTLAGAQLIDAYLSGGIGLQATYYTGADEVLVEKSAVGHLDGINVNFSAPAGRRLDEASLAADGPFSARWTGFIRLPFVQLYTFRPVLANESDRVRMWIDNQLVLDQWSSLNATSPIITIAAEPYHSLPDNNVSLRVEYRHVSGNAGLRLKWATTNFTQIPLAPSVFVARQWGPIDDSSCRAVGLSPLSIMQECVTAATALGYPAVRISEILETYWPPWPTGCVWEMSTSSLFYNTALDSEECSGAYKCLCGGYISEQVVARDKLTQAHQLSSRMITYVEGGLHATFFDYPDLTVPKMTIQTTGVDFSSAACSRIECDVDDLHPGVSVKMFTDDDHVSARWAGFLKVPYPQTFTFDAPVQEKDERVKVWIDNQLLIDMWDSLAAMVPSQTVKFQCADNTFLPIKIEYKDISGAQGLKLSWRTREMGTIQRDLIPAPRLAVGVQRERLPMTMSNQPDVFCSVTSLQFGSSLSISTAGVVHTFTLLGRDQFGNFRTINEDDVSNLQVVQVSHDWREWTVDQGRTLSTRGDIILAPDRMSYTGQYRAITRAGPSMLFAAFANIGGLAATFYDDMWLSETAAVKTVAPYAYPSLLLLSGADDVPGTVQGTQPPPASDGGYTVSLSESTDYSVRWNGFVKPEYSGVYSVWLGFGIAREDRARMWIDNRLIIDEWATFGTDFQDGSAFDIKLLIEVGASVHFHTPEQYYQIQIEYKHREGPQMITLMWAHAQQGLVRSYISTQRLAWGLDSPGSPWPVYNRPAPTCATKSYAEGTDITVSTAGKKHTFHIYSRDEFLNPKDEGGDNYAVRIYSCCGPEIKTGTLGDQNNGQYSVSYTSLTRSGDNTIFATLATPGGLSATYYDDPHMMLPRKIQLSPIVSMYAAFGRSPSAPLSTYDLFGARWGGFIKATQSGLYTFRTVIGGDDERVKLWIDNKVIVDHWTSLNTLNPKGTMLINANLSNWYPVELLYRQYAGIARMELEWSTSSIANTIIPSYNLYQSHTLNGFPTPSVNQPAKTCADNSEAFAVGLTLAKICADASFTITARDSFSNPLTADQAEWYVRLTNAPNRNFANLPDSFTYPGSTEWARNSRYIASYIAQGTGNWNFVTLLEGPYISATYYDSPNLNASTAATSLIQETIDFSSACEICAGVACHCTLPEGVVIDGKTYADEAGFSVRWAGFITPPDLGLYALRFKLRARMEADYEGRVALSSDERVRLWVDNKIVFDQWDSLSKDEFVSNFRFARDGLHDFKMEYSKQPNPNTAQYGETWKLSWLYQDSDLAITEVIPSSVFTYGNDILRQPFQYFVDPPKVAYALPLNGPAIGATPVRIFGANFGEKEPEICTRTVYIGSTGVDTDDGRVQWQSSSSITAFTAPGVGCCHNITVHLLGMQSAETGFARYTYDAPHVTGIRLANAAATGEAIVTVIGGNFGSIDYTPRSRLGGTACISTSWLSDSSLECSVPSGNNDGDDLDMGILVTVANQFMRPGATFTKGFTYDEPVMSTIAPNNAMVAGGTNVTVFGYAIAPTYDPSPESRIGGTASEATFWLSESSILCLVSRGVSKDKRITISLEMFIDTTSDIFSYNAPALFPNASYNQPPNYNQTIITVSGVNFALEDRTSRARIAQSDTRDYITNDHKMNQGTATVLTTWISNSALLCKSAIGLQASQKIAVTTGMLEAQIHGQITEVFSYDIGRVSGAVPTRLNAAGSAQYQTFLGSCEPAGGAYSSKFIAEYICNQVLNLGMCPGSTSCPCLGVYEDSAGSFWRLCYRINWNGTMALPLSMCDGVLEGELAPNGILRCNLLSIHMGNVENFAVGVISVNTSQMQWF